MAQAIATNGSINLKDGDQFEITREDHLVGKRVTRDGIGTDFELPDGTLVIIETDPEGPFHRELRARFNYVVAKLEGVREQAVVVVSRAALSDYARREADRAAEEKAARLDDLITQVLGPKPE